MESSVANLADIRRYEELAANTWPALSVLCLEGWLLRSADGYSKRANSVLPLYPSALPLPEHIALCEAHYARLGQKTVFKLTQASQPEGLDRELERRGYRLVEEVSVQRASLLPAERYGRQDAGPSVAFIAAEPWLDLYLRANQAQNAHRETIARLFKLQAYPCLHAVYMEEGKAAAFGMAVAAGKHAAVYDIVTAPEFRRRGCAKKLLQALLAKAAEAGAEEAFLQVLEDNHAALALYEKLGFREHYRQWYRINETFGNLQTVAKAKLAITP